VIEFSKIVGTIILIFAIQFLMTSGTMFAIAIVELETCPLRFEGHAWKTTSQNLYKYVEIRR
jgi:hypothetical protein